MKKLQLIIIISAVILAFYAFPADFMMRDVIDSPCTDSHRSRHIELRTAKHGSADTLFIITSSWSRPTFFTGVGIAGIQSDNAEIDIDIPEEPKVNDHGVTLISLPIEGASILRERYPLAALLFFPLEAYRLRI